MSAQVRIVVTTRDEHRHRLFLALLEARLGRPPDGVLVQAATKHAGTHRAGIAQSARTRLGGRVARHFSLDPVRRLGRLRLEPREPVDVRLQRLLEPLRPIDLDDLARRTDVRVDSDANSPESIRWLERLRPDLLLVFGGRILREPWISLPRLGGVNMHYGVLPEYGGAASAEYALYHDRFDLVGATIHMIAAAADAGPILRRCRVEVPAGADLEDCQALVYRAGLEALAEHAAAAPTDTGREGEPQRGTHVYRRGPQALAVEAVAQLRLLQAGEPFPPIERSLEKLPRGRGLRGRISTSRIPPGVYVLLYHSLVGTGTPQRWERAFAKVSVRAERFREHAAYVAAHLTPIELSEAVGLLQLGPTDRPYVALTFDDGYTNLLTAAAPTCRELGLRPTVFVSASLAAGETVNYRVLLAELIDRGLATEAAAVLSRELGGGYDAGNVWVRSKDAYQAGMTEPAVELAWTELVGEPRPSAHLTFEELRRLAADGWSIGNHTLDHVPLVGLEPSEVEHQVVENERRLAAAGLAPIPWLSYPLGRSDHVDNTLAAFMDRHPELMGIFAGGGVNLVASRKEWLRIGVRDEDVETLRRDLFREARATIEALEQMIRRE